MLLQNWVGDLPAEQSEEMESGARSGRAWPRKPAARSVIGGGMLVWVRFPQACPSSLGPLQREAQWWQTFHISGKKDYAGSSQTKESHLWLHQFQGDRALAKLLLIFNTKSQGNSEGKDTLLAQIEIGEWQNSQLVPVSSPSSPIHLFASLLE